MNIDRCSRDDGNQAFVDVLIGVNLGKQRALGNAILHLAAISPTNDVVRDAFQIGPSAGVAKGDCF